LKRMSFPSCLRERALVIFISARNQGDIEGRDTRLMSALRS